MWHFWTRRARRVATRITRSATTLFVALRRGATGAVPACGLVRSANQWGVTTGESSTHSTRPALAIVAKRCRVAGDREASTNAIAKHATARRISGLQYEARRSDSRRISAASPSPCCSMTVNRMGASDSGVGPGSALANCRRAASAKNSSHSTDQSASSGMECRSSSSRSRVVASGLITNPTTGC